MVNFGKVKVRKIENQYVTFFSDTYLDETNGGNQEIRFG